MAIAPTSTGFLEDSEGLYIFKDPSASKDYTVKWDQWLNGETIVDATWDVQDGLTIVNQGNTVITTFVEVSGGEPGQAYVCTTHIKTNTNREDEMSFRVVVKDF